MAFIKFLDLVAFNGSTDLLVFISRHYKKVLYKESLTAGRFTNTGRPESWFCLSSGSHELFSSISIAITKIIIAAYQYHAAQRFIFVDL
jgi:hypothetical protein